ncbi:MAG: hypothetical protein M5F18_04320, partial [Asgard group archaeon]|nr:hypothetical protein [Asgard group archaeon]
MLRRVIIRSKPSVFITPGRRFTITRTNNGVLSGINQVLFGEKGEKEAAEKEEAAARKVESKIEDANLKVGKTLADGIQGAQDSVKDAKDTAKDVEKGAEDVNLKTGKVLAYGIQDAQDTATNVKDTV